MTGKFRKYWTASRCGDRITMEHIQNNWIGVYLLSGKLKCVENYLTGTETEYKQINNIILQDICMNISSANQFFESYDFWVKKMKLVQATLQILRDNLLKKNLVVRIYTQDE